MSPLSVVSHDFSASYKKFLPAEMAKKLLKLHKKMKDAEE